MRRPLPLFLLFLAAYLAVIGNGWFRQGMTAGELSGHAAKIEAILALLRSGDFAWFPAYLTGSPSATLLSFVLSIPVYAPALLLVDDPAVAMKSTALALLALGGVAAFGFGKRLAGSGWSGFAIGCAWLLSPQILLRAGWQEHMTILVVIPLVPLTFLALLRVAERGTPFDAILLAASFSAALLAWSKMGATLALPLAIFALWMFAARPECRRHLLRGAAWAFPATLLLGVAPLLPLLRERAFMTVFELDPFRQWQAIYSAHCGTAWLDRAGGLFASLPAVFTHDQGGYYLGLVGTGAVAIVIFLAWREKHPMRDVALIRVFLVIALLMFWISHGPRSVLQGHFELLADAEPFPDLGVVLHWLVLAAQGALIFWCLPHGRWRVQAFVALFAIYLLAPIFRLLELFPLYADLRAPDSFWILNGTFAWAVASALSLVVVLRKLPSSPARSVVAAIALAAAAWDFSPYFGWFSRGDLGARNLSDYREAAAYLRDRPGRVHTVTTRYFPLDLPLAARRDLSTEALNHYLMPRDTARLQDAAYRSATNMLAYLQLAGIGDVLLSAETQSPVQKWFRALLPVGFENSSFTILTNPQPLYPAFFAETATPAAGKEEFVEALRQAQAARLAIASPQPADSDPRAAPGDDFIRLDPASPRGNSRVTFNAPGQAGWIVLSESWHPDWKGFVNGAPAAIARAAGGFPAIPTPAGNATVEFRFQPPWWYAGALASGALSWVLALGFLATSRWLPASLTREAPRPARSSPSWPRPAIRRPIALVPTYNEADTIAALLDRMLADGPGLQALIVDDGSPDGTAALVRAHPDFGSRVHLLERPEKQGLGSAYRDGFRWALDRGYDACIEIDADLSHDPADIPRLLASLDAGADAVVGSRYLDGLRVVHWPRHRLWLSTGASHYVRLLTGLPLTDATSGFKAIRAAALAGIDWQELRADGYGFQVELHWLLWQAGTRIEEIPIVFTERRAGATKMTAGIACEAAWRVVQLAMADQPRRPAP